MKIRILIVLLVGAMITGACGFSGNFGRRTLRGTGNVISETRAVSDFHQISIDGAGELYLTQGDQESLKIEAEDNILEKIETSVDNGKLVISYESGFLGWNLIPTEPIRFYLTVVEVDDLTINGAARLISEQWQGDHLALNINGAGDIELDGVEFNLVELKLEGGSECSISGTTDELVVRVDGAGSINLDDLQSRKADVVVNGVSDVRLWVTETLDVEVNGAGSVRYYGDPEVTSKIEGIGSVRSLGDK